MNLIGKRFGRLTVVEQTKSLDKCAWWLCICDCGKQYKVRTHHLTRPRDSVVSCGCRKRELLQKETIICRTCGLSKPATAFYYKSRRQNLKTRHASCRECLRKRLNDERKKRNCQDRFNALIAYGGNPPSCNCCGETLYEFLAIDHLNGDGAKHRKEIGSHATYRWLRQKNYPPGFRVLCHSCNSAIGSYGYCPHQYGAEEARPEILRLAAFLKQPFSARSAISQRREHGLSGIHQDDDAGTTALPREDHQEDHRMLGYQGTA